MRSSRTRLVILLATVLGFCACALALDPALDISQYAHTTWKVRDGFVKGAIASMAQTPDGYLWLGTQFGLFRFDGIRTSPWLPPGGQQVPSGTVLSLLVTRDGSLWIGANGLARWNGSSLVEYPEFREQFVFALHEDPAGTLWVGTAGTPYGRLCVIRGGNVHCKGNDGSLGVGIFALYQDSSGGLWAGARDGLWRWEPGPPKFYSLPGVTNGIQAMCDGSDGSLLVGWKKGLYRLRDGKTEPYSLPGTSLEFEARRILRDRNGALWIATWNHGLIHVHQGTTDVFSAADGLSGDNDPNLFEDHEENIWVSTLEGLDRFRDYSVVTFSAKQGLRNLLGSLLADQESGVWLATYGGMNRWVRGRITDQFFDNTNRDGRLKDLHPQSLFQDNQGRVWIATSDQIGYLEHDRFVLVRKIAKAQILSIIRDTANTVWAINEHAGLLRISPQNEILQIPWPVLGHQDHASVLAADRKRGGLWIGFFRGGISYYSDGQIQSSYTRADGLGDGRISDILFDADGTLWISTNGGLSRLKNNRLETLTSRNGLPCDTVHWALEDNENSIWLYTACGLVRIARSELDGWATGVDRGPEKKSTIQVTTFDSADGVESVSEPGHYHPQAAKTLDGKIWFLPLDGLSVIDPHNLHENKLPPPAHIEKITADDANVDVSSGIHLPTGVRHLDIDYTALSLVVPEKVRFRVKLEGQDKDWRELVNVRHVEYTNLPPKHYRFRVLACNNSGVWNEEGAALDFVIPPAWYQTNWFYALCAAAFLASLWAAHQLRVRQLAHDFNLRLEERVAERTRVARDLHDTLLQSFQALLPRLQAGINMFATRPADALRTLEQAADQASQAIAEGRDAIQGMRMSTVEKNDLAVAIRTVGEELASAATKPPSSNFNVVVEGASRNLHPILRDEVYRLAVEALRNAFRHAAAQNVEVEIRYDAKYFRLRVRDDGKGIPSDVLSGDGREGHYGLPGMRERAKLVGGKLTIWTELDGGTEIELNIPGASAFVKSARPFWQFGKRSAREPDEKETIERE